MKRSDQVIKALRSSPELGDWIMALKDVEGLFFISDPKQIINKEKDSEGVSFCDGLSLFEAYFSSGGSSKEIYDFASEAILNALEVFRTVPEDKKPLIDYRILNSMFEAIVSNDDLARSVDFEFFVRTFIASERTHKYLLYLKLFRRKAFFVLDPETMIRVANVLISEGLFDESFDYLTSNDMNFAISKRPMPFYNVSKDALISTKKRFFDMASGYLYPEKDYYDKDIESIYINWFKKSSKFVAKDALMNDLRFFFGSKKTHLKKVGLSVVNINFDRLNDFFFERIDDFFSDTDFYPDLIQLIANNIEAMSSETINAIIKANETVLDTTDDCRIGLLKNRIKMLISKRKSIPYRPETKNERIEVENYGRLGYIVEGGLEDDKMQLFEEYKKLDYEDALTRFNGDIEKSRYFEVVAYDAFYRYLMQWDEDFILGHIKDFNSGLSACLISNFESSDKLPKLLLEIAKKDDNVPFSSLLFAISRLLNKGMKDNAYEVLMYVDYKRLGFRDNIVGDSFVNDLINEDFEMYFEMLAGCVYSTGAHFDRLKETLEYAIENFDPIKTKALIAFKIGMIASIDKEYALSLIDYAFDNEKDGINVSYLMYSYGFSGGIEIVDILSGKSDCKTFLELRNKGHDVSNAQTNLFLKITQHYLAGKIGIERLVPFMASKNFGGIRECFELISNALDDNGHSVDSKRVGALVDLIDGSTNADDFCEAQEDADQLARQVARFICKTNGSFKSSWTLILKCFAHFKRFFSDECLDLLKQFKDSEIENITEIMNKYIGSYDVFRVDEETLIKALKLFKKDSRYKDAYKKWKVSITKKNIYFELEENGL